MVKPPIKPASNKTYKKTQLDQYSTQISGKIKHKTSNKKQLAD
jgi:hypothetical protein